MNARIDPMLAEAHARPLLGWDFSWLGDRLVTTPLTWSFAELVGSACAHSPDLLDLGTGGGEWLSQLASRPARSVATESWTPNVAIAHARLHPLGVPVVQTEGAPDNAQQSCHQTCGRLPFAAAAFHLIVARHEAFSATEVRRVLAARGCFLTQQVADASTDDLDELLGWQRVRAVRRWDLERAVQQVERAGLEVVSTLEDEQVVTFADAGALAWYVKACPWWYPDFDIQASRQRLAALQDRIDDEGPLAARQPHFFLEARPR